MGVCVIPECTGRMIQRDLDFHLESRTRMYADQHIVAIAGRRNMQAVGMKIGGIDNSVIKHANGGEPYIPGSSLKGKMRSLLEWNIGVVELGRANDKDKGQPFSSKFFKDVW